MHPAWTTVREVTPSYQRHQREHTLLYQIIDQSYPPFLLHLLPLTGLGGSLHESVF